MTRDYQKKERVAATYIEHFYFKDNDGKNYSEFTLDEALDENLTPTTQAFSDCLDSTLEYIEKWLSSATDPLTAALLSQEAHERLLELPAEMVARNLLETRLLFLLDTLALEVLQDHCVANGWNLPQSFQAIRRYHAAQYETFEGDD